MILKRKIYNKMLEWKNKSSGKTALLLEGARRVGKSFICQEFALHEYKSHIIVDFANIDSKIKDLFIDESYNLDIFFSKLANLYDVRLIKRQSLIVFDEIQLLPRARQLIKYLVADGRYDYIETGSLLSIKTNIQNIVIPSEEERMEMFPLDFEEFLWAMGNTTTAPALMEFYEKRMPLGEALHRRVLNLFRQYMLVGGMPQAVLAFIGDMDYEAADREKRRILDLYREDIGKFALSHSGRVARLFDEIPGQLSRKEKVYRLSALGEQARMRTYEDAFLWLADAMVVNPCFNATEPHAGLALSQESARQKCYMADTGLLVTHAFRDTPYLENFLYRAILLDKLGINEGMLMENIVAQMLRAKGYRLFFYSRRGDNYSTDTMEIDFLLRKGVKICPVEVKSSAFRKHSSLDKFRMKFAKAIRESVLLYPRDVMVRDGVLHLPLYMAMCL